MRTSHAVCIIIVFNEVLYLYQALEEWKILDVLYEEWIRFAKYQESNADPPIT